MKTARKRMPGLTSGDGSRARPRLYLCSLTAEAGHSLMLDAEEAEWIQ